MVARPSGPVIVWCWARSARLFRRGRARLVSNGDEILHALHGEEAVTTAIRIGAVWSAPTWVRNAAISTIENDAGATDPGTAASRQENASPNGTLGNTWWTSTPAVPPMNREENGSADESAALADGEGEHLRDQDGDDQAQPEGPASLSTVLS